MPEASGGRELHRPLGRGRQDRRDVLESRTGGETAGSGRQMRRLAYVSPLLHEVSGTPASVSRRGMTSARRQTVGSQQGVVISPAGPHNRSNPHMRGKEGLARSAKPCPGCRMALNSWREPCAGRSRAPSSRRSYRRKNLSCPRSKARAAAERPPCNQWSMTLLCQLGSVRRLR